jgi:hypothetical protein
MIFVENTPIKACMASKVTKLIFSASSEVAHPDRLSWFKKLKPKFSCMEPFDPRENGKYHARSSSKVYPKKSVCSFLD